MPFERRNSHAPARGRDRIEIDFGSHGKDAETVSPNFIRNLRRIAGFRQPQHEIGFGHSSTRPRDPLGFHRVFGIAQAGRVRKHDQHAIQIEPNLDDIARRARMFGHNGHVALRNRVEERGFA